SSLVEPGQSRRSNGPESPRIKSLELLTALFLLFFQSQSQTQAGVQKQTVVLAVTEDTDSLIHVILHRVEVSRRKEKFGLIPLRNFWFLKLPLQFKNPVIGLGIDMADLF